MNPFGYTIKLGDPKQEYFETIEALVDTGSIHTWISNTVLERLGYTPQYRGMFQLENGDIGDCIGKLVGKNNKPHFYNV